MAKVQMLRLAVKQRAAAAAEEMFELFEKTLAEFEQELRLLKEENEEQRKILDAVFHLPHKIRRADVQQLLESKKMVHPEPPHMNEEQEKIQTSQEGEKLQELVGVDNPSSTAEDSGGSEQLTVCHSTETKPLSCPLCDETFIHEMYLTIHMGEQHAGEEPFTCCVCEKSFATITQLSEHECVDESLQPGCGGSEAARYSHPEEPLPPLSDKKASDWAETGLNGHWMEPLEPQLCLKAKSRSDTPSFRNFGCSLCFKTVQCRRGLMAHMRIHSTGRNAICCVCYKTFAFEPKRKTYTCLCGPLQHQQRQPQGNGAPPASSPPEPMQTEDDRRSDVDGNSHPDGLIPPLSDEESSECGETGFSEPQSELTSLKNIKRDLRCNTDKKPFNSLTFGCSLCCKEFATRINLVAHLICHSGTSRTKCRVCKKKFVFHSQRNTYKCCCESSQLPSSGGPTEHAGEEAFCCNVCGKNFPTITQLDEHRSKNDSGGPKETVARMTSMRRGEAKRLLGSYSGFESNEEMQTEDDINDIGKSKQARKSVRIRTLRCRDTKESFGSDSCSEDKNNEQVMPVSYLYCSQGFTHNPVLIPDSREHTGEKPFEAVVATKKTLCNPSQLHQRQTEQKETGADGGSESEGNSHFKQHPMDDSRQGKELITLSGHTSVHTDPHRGAEQEPPPIKEEQEECWISQEGERLQGLVVVEITSSPVSNG